MPVTRAQTALFSALAGSLGLPAMPAAAQVEAPTSAPALSTTPSASLVTGPGVLVGGLLRLSGTFPAAGPGSTVQIQRLVADSGWVATATVAAQTGGVFYARWRPDTVGRFTLRAVTLGGGSAQAAGTAPTAEITVPRGARATWYGPGFYGRRTACGQRMSPMLAGVAHRTLPCGTPVELLVGRRTAIVPVVDRGPYAGGAHYDLTSATAKALGLSVTRTIGVAPRRGEKLPSPLVPVAPTGGVPVAPAAD